MAVNNNAYRTRQINAGNNTSGTATNASTDPAYTDGGPVGGYSGNVDTRGQGNNGGGGNGGGGVDTPPAPAPSQAPAPGQNNGGRHRGQRPQYRYGQFKPNQMPQNAQGLADMPQQLMAQFKQMFPQLAGMFPDNFWNMPQDILNRVFAQLQARNGQPNQGQGNTQTQTSTNDVTQTQTQDGVPTGTQNGTPPLMPSMDWVRQLPQEISDRVHSNLDRIRQGQNGIHQLPFQEGAGTNIDQLPSQPGSTPNFDQLQQTMPNGAGNVIPQQAMDQINRAASLGSQAGQGAPGPTAPSSDQLNQFIQNAFQNGYKQDDVMNFLRSKLGWQQ